MGLVLPAEMTPLPDPSGPMGHAHDFVVVPAYVALGAQVPEEVLASFGAFKGERTLRRTITGSRVATAWLADKVMIGGEITGKTRGANPNSGQFHPATIHWQVPGGEVGWMKLHASPLCDAEAGKETLSINSSVAGDYTFRLCVSGLAAEKLLREQWTLPGLVVRIDTDAISVTTTPGDGFVDVVYANASRVILCTAIP